MFTKKNTLKEIMTDPLIAPLASSFITNMDLTQASFYEMTVESIAQNRMFHGYSLLNGFNRLAEALSDGSCVYPLYTDAECAGDSKKKDAFFMYFPSWDPGADSKPFVVAVPGGGNVTLCNMTEGFPIADHFNKLGFHVLVLNYRVCGPGLYPAPLDDMAQLLRYVQAHRDELHINAGQYITVGFSAGGYLVNTWSTDNHGYPSYGLPKPELNISVYGFVSWKNVKEGWNVDDFGITSHGLTVQEAAKTDWNVEDHVSSFPPTYILHGGDDHACDCVNSYVLADALKAAEIPYVLEIGPGMDHGFGEAFFSPLRGWIERAVNFWESLTTK